MRRPRQRGGNDGVKRPKERAKAGILVPRTPPTVARGHAAEIILQIFATVLGATSRRVPRIEPRLAIVAMIAARRCDGCSIVNVSGSAATRTRHSLSAEPIVQRIRMHARTCHTISKRPVKMAALFQSSTIEPPATMDYLATPINHGRTIMTTIQKRVLAADRVRHPPRDGFSWVDRRFLRDFAAKLSGNAVFLYFFLSAVSDKHGLSYYADSTISGRLRMRERWSPRHVKS